MIQLPKAQLAMLPLLPLLLVLLGQGCFDPGESTYYCNTSKPECPEGLSCNGTQCVKGGDIGTLDAKLVDWIVTSLAPSAGLKNPSDLVLDDKTGLLYVADTDNNCIRTIDTQTEKVQTFTGVCAGSVGLLARPKGLAIVPTTLPVLVVVSSAKHCVRSYPLKSPGVGVTVAGKCGDVGGNTKNPDDAKSSELLRPTDVEVRNNDSILIVDSGNHCVVEVYNLKNPKLRVLAGQCDPKAPLQIKDGALADARFLHPKSVVRVAPDRFLVTEWGAADAPTGGRIREINTKDNTVKTVAGPAEQSPQVQALLDGPTGLVVNAAGFLFSDTGKNQLRLLDLAGSKILTVSGTSAGVKDNVPLHDALFKLPAGLAASGAGKIYVADSGNGRIRVISRP